VGTRVETKPEADELVWSEFVLFDIMESVRLPNSYELVKVELRTVLYVKRILTIEKRVRMWRRKVRFRAVAVM
jgi:hypothetical protein